VPLIADRVGAAARELWLLLGAAALLLVLSCASVSSLLVAAAVTRRHEIAIRTSIGATRSNVLRELLAEHLILGVLGCTLGVVLAVWVVSLASSFVPVGILGVETPALSARAALLCSGIAVITTLAFGLSSAGAAIISSPQRLLSGTRDDQPRSQKGHRLNVAIQLGLVLVLLVCAGLLTESLIRIRFQTLGFDPSSLIVVGIDAAAPATVPVDPASGIGSTRETLMRQLASLDRMRTGSLLAHVRALPNVTSASAARAAPFSQYLSTARVRRVDMPQDEALIARRDIVTVEYFRTMRIRVLRGRTFESQDVDGQRVTVISSALERKLFGGSALDVDMVVGDYTYKVIGVVADVKQRTPAEGEFLALYFPYSGGTVTHVAIRTDGDASHLASLAKVAIAQHDRAITVNSVDLMSDLVSASMATEHFRTAIASFFGAVGLGLAIVGVYVVSARMVSARRREFAVRVALGAEPRHLRGLVLRDAGWIVGAGLLGGMPLAFIASHAMVSTITGVPGPDIHTYALPAMIVAVVALAATCRPALVAGRTDAVVALKE
jgi:predicted permease